MRVSGLLVICFCLVACVADVPQTRPPDMAVRRVEANTLVSLDQPKVRLQVDPTFTALPVLAFPIRHDTWAERYIFVDSAADKTVRRLIIVQFEHALAGSSFRFVYPSTPPMKWGSAVYRSGVFIGDSAREIAQNPQLEVAQTQRFLQVHGYKVGNWWNIARLARVADADGKSEIIVFYQESIVLSPGSAPPNADADADLPDDLVQSLFTHLNGSVTSD
jgi:hypothetical protein